MKSLSLTLKYQDGTLFIVGGFDSNESLQKWVDNEKEKPYWDPLTEIIIEEVEHA